MITAKAFAGKHYAVLGLARSGLATVEALLASGARVTAWDDKEEARAKLLPGTGRGTVTRSGGAEGGERSEHGGVGPLHHRFRGGPPPRAGEELEVANFLDSDLAQFDSIVVTPGLPLNRHPIAQRAADAGVEIIGGLFVLEAVSVIVQVFWFKRYGRRIFKMAPIHHHFEHLGWSEPTVVIRFWIISFILALAGLSTLKLR